MSSAPDTRAVPSPAAIELQDVVYSVAGRAILSGLDLTVPAGEIMSIMGASGCGKTTLLKAMIGLVRPAGGRILIEGQDIAAMGERQLNGVRKQMGLVFQYAALFDSLTVWENIAFGLLRQRRPRREIDQTVDRLLAAVGLRPDVKDLYPNELSGGMQKRVGMARALALDPKIVLYDEPTSGLDPIMATTIDELILSLREQFRTTAVVVSHHVPSILRISAQVAMLHDGKIIARGSPEQIRQADNPLVRQFLEGSTKGPLAAGDSGAKEVH
jgi:phospholipid/cholesterol/gamma-HCH transport system ATP-binding protein